MTTLTGTEKPTSTTMGRLWPMEHEFSETRREIGPSDFPDPLPLRAYRRIRERTEERVAEVEAIKASEHLSDAGKAEQIRATHEAAVKGLQPFQKYLETVEADLERERARLTPQSLEPGDAAAVEYRAFLRGLDADKRAALVNQAVIEGDVDFLGKVVGGRPEVSGLTPTTWDMARQALIEHENPDGLERVRLLEENAQGVRKSLDNSVSIMNELAGLDFDRSTVIAR